MTTTATSLINALSRPLFTSRTDSTADVPERRREGIFLQTWMVTLIISFLFNVVGFAFAWGTVVTRIEYLSERLARIERRMDAEDARTRGPANHQSPGISR